MGTGLRRIDDETRAVRVKDVDGNVVKLGYVVDSSGEFVPFPTNDMGQMSLRISDQTSIDLFGQILLELKIINTHLSIITDNYIKEEDI